MRVMRAGRSNGGTRARVAAILVAALLASAIALPAGAPAGHRNAAAAKKKCKAKAGKKKSKLCKKKRKGALKDSGLSIDPVNIEYGTVLIGQTSPQGVLTVTNTGNYTSGHLTLAFGGPHQSQFPIDGDTCSGAQLASGGKCTITTHFAPTSLGSKSVTVSVIGTQGGTDLSLLRGTGGL